MGEVEDEDVMYEKLLKQPTDNRPEKPDKAKPKPSSESKPSSGSKVDLPKDNVQVLNIETSTYSLVNPDVVIEVEGTEEARQRGYVTIEIENPYPDLDVQIVVRTKKNWILTVRFLHSKLLLTVLFHIQATWFSTG